MKISVYLFVFFAHAATAAVPVNVSDEVEITVPKSQPPFVKQMDPALVSFSLEFQYWPTYAGNATNQPNKYVNQLLRNLGERTGKTPAIRVGGTSENTAYVDPSLQLWNASHLGEVYGPFINRSNTSIGRDWYVVAGNLPAGTEFTFGLNLYDQAEVAAQTRMLEEAFQGPRAHLTKAVTLKFIQVGNEPNFYFPSAASFVVHWETLAETVLQNIRMGGHSNPTFWIGSEVITGDLSLALTLPFQLRGTLEAGILDNDDIARNDFILEEHQYSGRGLLGAIPGGPPPGTLMNKASIRSNLSAIYVGSWRLKATAGRITWSVGSSELGVCSVTDLCYSLQGEAGNYAREALYGLSNTGESAIWAVDYMLHAASMGVVRVYLHSTPNRMFSVFQPGWGFTNGTGIDRPHIMAMYNGLLVVDEMTGMSGQAMIAEIDNNNNALATYGVWENGKLSRMAIINSNVFSENATTRSALNVTLRGGVSGGHKTIKRLDIPYTTATENITWAGQSFETESGASSGDIVEETIGGMSVTVAASEVVLLCFK